MYKLSNHPNILNQVIYPYAYWDNFLSDELLEKTIEYCKDNGTDRSFIVNEYGNEVEAPSIRKSKIMMHLCNENNSFVFDKFLDIATHMNDNFFNFDLLGFDHFQYTVYDEAGSHYDFHADAIFGENLPRNMVLTRKLSFSLVLSDSSEYEGGDFEILINGGDPIKVEQKKGRIIAFPSFMMHRVAPVTSGCRKSIVFWAVGPKFK
jgi:PKHD-type hydroxylase